jgi:hypothetical protein
MTRVGPESSVAEDCFGLLDSDLPAGRGTFAHATLRTLDDLADLVTRKDQTLTQFGFTSQLTITGHHLA